MNVEFKNYGRECDHICALYYAIDAEKDEWEYRGTYASSSIARILVEKEHPEGIEYYTVPERWPDMSKR